MFVSAATVILPWQGGQPIGRVHYPDDLGKPPCVNHAPRRGFMLCKRSPGQVRRGDNVAIIGQDLDLGTLVVGGWRELGIGGLEGNVRVVEKRGWRSRASSTPA